MLHARGLFEMEAKAREGYYDDFKSPLATPCVQLVQDLNAAGCSDLGRRAINGEWDSTEQEAEEWYRTEGHKLNL